MIELTMVEKGQILEMIELTTEEKGLILEMLNKNAFPGSMARSVSDLIEKVEACVPSELEAETELDFDGVHVGKVAD